MKLLLPLLLSLFCISCGTGTKITTVSPSESATNECRFRDEVCSEAIQFQGEFNAMPKEQQKELIQALNSLNEQCAKAQKQCEQSRK